MSRLQVEQSRVIDAPADRLYGVLADYRVGHPAILPKPFFTRLTVEEGGQGAGTVLQIEMNAYGSRRAFRQVVAEPEPGRVLTESNTDGSAVTTFTVRPLEGGARAEVTIATDVAVAPGLRGAIEKLLSAGFLRRVYRLELEQLAAYVAGRTDA